ncbi:DUF2946 family protein [uncultured Hydrogenophaga sp.]|uniref:DUF2946 family protein n=1 Tax=uncultured Hydrogenophaga sp. TaxID=199683 RepID=UPI00265E9901|nr:DUF2946 family protein [uncultured Hydrogenophaga sp.]
MFSVHLRRLCTWMALWVMVLGALQPATAHAWRGAQDSANWVQVCSTTGMFWVRTDASASASATTDADGGPSQPGSAPMVSVGQCPICVSHGAAGLPPLTGPMPVQLSAGSEPPLTDLNGPVGAPLPRPSSRGPPTA